MIRKNQMEILLIIRVIKVIIILMKKLENKMKSSEIKKNVINNINVNFDKEINTENNEDNKILIFCIIIW